MCQKVSFGLHILLPANMAIPSQYGSAAVQAVLFFSLGGMRQGKFFLKISTKNTRSLSFPLLNNSGNFD
jgi:hypothetical protein